MPLYSFTIGPRSGQNEEVRWTYLVDRRQACRFARIVISDLKGRPEYRDPNLTMIVRDKDGDVIDIVGF